MIEYLDPATAGHLGGLVGGNKFAVLTTLFADGAHIDTLAQRYRGTDYGREILTERVIIAIRPERLTLRGPTG
jgi:hypothetical protein